VLALFVRGRPAEEHVVRNAYLQQLDKLRHDLSASTERGKSPSSNAARRLRLTRRRLISQTLPRAI
jgi:hypothetical protein